MNANHVVPLSQHFQAVFKMIINKIAQNKCNALLGIVAAEKLQGVTYACTSSSGRGCY